MNEINFNIEDIEKIDLSMDVGIKEIYPPIDDLEVTPTKEQQIFTHENSYGYDKVTVNPIPEEYIIPDGTLNVDANGDVDVTMFRMARVGVYTPPNLQDKSVTITENGTQNITADSGYDGLGNVEVITNVAGSGGGDEEVPTDINEIWSVVNNSIVKYSNAVINSYPTYTNDNVTLYTPDVEYKHYMIRYRGGGEYGIIWFKNCFLVKTSNGVVKSANLGINSFKSSIDNYVIGTKTWSEYTMVAYLSSGYTSFEECIEALQNPNTVYTTSSNTANWTNYDDGDFTVSACNLPCLFGNASYYIIANISSRRISSNETIEVIS